MQMAEMMVAQRVKESVVMMAAMMAVEKVVYWAEKMVVAMAESLVEMGMM